MVAPRGVLSTCVRRHPDSFGGSSMSKRLRQKNSRLGLSAPQYWWVPIVLALLGGVGWLAKRYFERANSTGTIVAVSDSAVPVDIVASLDQQSSIRIPDGVLRLDGVAPGIHFLVFSATGFRKSRVGPLRVKGGKELSVSIPNLLATALVIASDTVTLVPRTPLRLLDPVSRDRGKWPILALSAIGPDALDIWIDGRAVGTTNTTQAVRPGRPLRIEWRQGARTVCVTLLQLQTSIRRNLSCDSRTRQVVQG